MKTEIYFIKCASSYSNLCENYLQHCLRHPFRHTCSHMRLRKKTLFFKFFVKIRPAKWWTNNSLYAPGLFLKWARFFDAHPSSQSPLWPSRPRPRRFSSPPCQTQPPPLLSVVAGLGRPAQGPSTRPSAHWWSCLLGKWKYFKVVHCLQWRQCTTLK